jgi:dihydropteroate synthase
VLDCAGRPLDLTKPQVMGILNVTPDSFADGGLYVSVDAALERARQMVEEGAAIVDVGGESTRPGATLVPVEQELARVVPIVEALHDQVSVPISVDTSKPEVMKAAVAAGAGMINDVTALRAPGALPAARDLGVPVCLMHMQGEPRTMQDSPAYGDVVAEVKTFLAERVAACVRVGIARTSLLIDPGFGFGKTLRHNLQLLKHLAEFRELGLPVLVGVSRKSMIGAVLGVPVEERLAGSLTLAALALGQGASLIRTHDVGPTVRVIKLCQAVQDAD